MTTMGKIGVTAIKEAVTELLPVIVKLQPVVPLTQAPEKPLNIVPAGGTAFKVTTEPDAHLVAQPLYPDGLEF